MSTRVDICVCIHISRSSEMSDFFAVLRRFCLSYNGRLTLFVFFYELNATKPIYYKRSEIQKKVFEIHFYFSFVYSTGIFEVPVHAVVSFQFLKLLTGQFNEKKNTLRSQTTSNSHLARFPVHAAIRLLS